MFELLNSLTSTDFPASHRLGIKDLVFQAVANELIAFKVAMPTIAIHFRAHVGNTCKHRITSSLKHTLSSKTLVRHNLLLSTLMDSTSSPSSWNSSLSAILLNSLETSSLGMVCCSGRVILLSIRRESVMKITVFQIAPENDTDLYLTMMLPSSKPSMVIRVPVGIASRSELRILSDSF